MKKIAGILLFIIFISISRNYAQGINFQKIESWSKVLKLAQEENKYIFVDVYATWCGPCKQMDASTYPDTALGNFMNSKFISIKVQQDHAKDDDLNIKSWYKDSKMLCDSLKIKALPTFLFFSRDGKLIARDLGFHNAEEFLNIAEKASLDPIQQLKNKIEVYKSGKKDYESMLSLIKEVQQSGNPTLSLEIAKDYKENYLDHFNESDLLNKKYLDFIGDYYSLINSRDKFFKLCYEIPKKVDEVKEYTGGGWADFQVTQTINREFIEPHLSKNNKEKEINWDGIYNGIKTKFPKIDNKKILLNAQVGYSGRSDQAVPCALEHLVVYRQLVKS